ncbi:plasmid replication protein RepC [Mesorhizobium sp.]|uniref:plasmid replication protein RepC n=1 Tax=Mesorhizobium sp. TaxID=1871066 RepID=UPI000FE98BDF|nr:plasmid replication protein RepC [Mesorhizobium sp.]RWG04115.1 MAG: replication initiation protein RepC [Mesorhizobium sp.]RWH01112.1 MAG: replication initiation protein RepC [Mesorhizobium sp.]TIR95014.1 MAG: replication initiation protein RepC [Mesorhizobium sp.]
MGTHIATTPFGRRPMTLGLISSQMSAKIVHQDAKVSKWQVFRDIREAKDALGATDRALAVLNALLTFHRDEELTGEANLVVFPSNEQLIRRANGMPPSTLRRHLAVLVDCGLIIRRDSPNGKRFARKGQSGAIEQAYGFDLSPILTRAQEFRELAEAVAVERKALRLVKERLTICRRDVVKLIDVGINESVPGNWSSYQRRYEAIIGGLPRTAPREVLEAIAGELEDLWADVHQTLELFIESQNPDANESHSGRHIQNSSPNHNPNGESENGLGNEIEAGRDAEHHDNVRSLPQRDVPLGMVLSACPDIANYTKGTQIRTWRDFAAAADRARPTLGVSPGAWQEAVEVMGSQNASITLAAILQRAEHIRSCGGYLRDLTEKARSQKFSVWPMVTALLNARVGALEKVAGKGGQESPAAQERGAGAAASSLDISNALRDSMKKKGW